MGEHSQGYLPRPSEVQSLIPPVRTQRSRSKSIPIVGDTSPKSIYNILVVDDSNLNR
jgi:hypothetical protein